MLLSFAHGFANITKQLFLQSIFEVLLSVQRVEKWRGIWLNTVKVLPVSAIQCIVGVWPAKPWIYILRKHLGLAWLADDESGRESGYDDAEEGG